ncbi:uncharacterized protein LOC105186048 [Harpegnathos saltator]|uniref:uncharacterized protein LOC105186048 n=1 Tax=Harpegnathos saltator TaxID=610380 RepID=UPI000DBEEDC9|nr:uncharacterized protein LOC105186048 [Harpegnathos saltator]
MANLTAEVIIGVDLWARLQIALPPPPRDFQRLQPPRVGIIEGGLTTRTDEEKARFNQFLTSELALFDKVSGPTPSIRHQIRVCPGTSPIKQRYRPQNPAMQAIIDEEVTKIEAEGVIEPSSSAWSSPVVLVRKKDGGYRFCIDFRKVNEVTERDAYPLPQISATLDRLRGARYLSSLDLKNGYWQVPLTKDSKPIIAFTVPGRGLRQFTVLPFGLHSAPATFQRLVDTVLGADLEPHVLVYLDDIIVLSTTLDEHMKHLRETDANQHGLGAVLTQNLEKGERVIAYASRTLNQAEKNYSATELECLAIVWGIRRLREYLEGYTFTVVTDHQSLKWLQKLETAVVQTSTATGRLGRWKFELQQYTFNVAYRKGSQNRVADPLSRDTAVCEIREATGCSWYELLKKQVAVRPHDFPDYTIRDGVLHRHFLHTLDFREVPAENQWKKCVPTNDRREVLKRYHDILLAGDGSRRCWVRPELAVFRCLAYKASQRKTAGLLHATASHRPWKHVSIDLIGPLPRSRRGSTWLLTMQDRFTKWLETKPLRQATTPSVISGISDLVIYRHGCPAVITTDNGTQFTAKEFETFLTEHGIHHRTTPSYTPQCNLVERTNRTIKTMIVQFVDKQHRHWDEQLSALRFAYNTAQHSSTQFSPAFLNHGRELDRPHPADRSSTRAGANPQEVGKMLKETYELVEVHLAQAFQKQETHYNLRRRAWRPEVGDTVWKRGHPLSDKAKAFNAKLAPKYKGPLITNRVNNNRRQYSINIRRPFTRFNISILSLEDF